MGIIIALIIWLFICVYITGGNVTASWILFFAGIIGLIAYGIVKAKNDQNNDENNNFNNNDKINTAQTHQLPISPKPTPSNQTLPIKKTVPVQQTNIQERMCKYKELFANCDTVEEIINCYIAFNNAETRLKPSEIEMLKHYMKFNSKFKSQVWTREDLTNRVKEAVSSSRTATFVVADANTTAERTELIHSLVSELNRAAINMADTTLKEEFVKAPTTLNKSPIQEKIELYKELFSNCDTVEEIINCYISFNNPDTRFKPSEIDMLKYYMKFNSKFKFQEWTRDDLISRVKEAVSSPQTVTSVVADTNTTVEKTELIHSLISVLNRAATNMKETTIKEEFAKEPIMLNKSRIQRKIELYKTLFADCMTVDEVIEKYIANYSDVKFKKVEIMILRNYLQYHSIFKEQEWSERKIERMVTEKSNDMKVNVQIENSSVFAIYDTDDVQPSRYCNETIAPKSHPYSLFDKMRKMTSNFYYDRGADTFYKQAKFMESFEDSYEGYDEFKMYSPTYMSMNDHQLRTYFSWRTKVRKGVVLETSLSYVFVYIYELLHEVGSDSPMDGYRKLCSLSNDYSKYDKKIERYLKSWIHDYIIYNKLFEEVSEEEKAFFFSESGRTDELIKARYVEDSARFTELLNGFSYYNINKSVFFRDYKDDYCSALLLTYKNIEGFYLKNRKHTLVEKMFGAVSPSSWYPYRSAVFINYKITDEANIRVNEFEYYSCKKGDWLQYAIAPYIIDRTIITEIIKGTESYMRKLYEYPWQLKYEGTTQILSTMIEKAVVSYCEENGKLGEHTRKKARAKKLTNKSNTISAKTFKETKPLQTRCFTEENPEATKENLIADLLSVANTLSKKTVTVVEYKEEGKYPTTWFFRIFGSWLNAIKEAGLEASRSNIALNISEQEVIDDLIRVSKLLNKDSVTRKEYDENGQFSTSTVAKRVGSWALAVEKAGLRDLNCVAAVELPEEEYLRDIHRVANELGVTQLYREDYLNQGKHSLNAIRKKFGSWDVVAKKAGVFIEEIKSVSKKTQNNDSTQSQADVKPIAIEIDRSKLDSIRKEADSVRERLGVEYETIIQDVIEVPVEQSVDKVVPSENLMLEFVKILSDTQKQALAIILSNEINMHKIVEHSQKHRIMPEILLESINELSLDTLDDNIIDTAGEPFVYDEYINALQELIKGE